MTYSRLHFAHDEAINLLREQVQQFMAKELTPRAQDIDASNQFPMDIWRKFGDMGLLGITVSEEYGGVDMGYLAQTIAVEEISRASEIGRASCRERVSMPVVAVSMSGGV